MEAIRYIRWSTLEQGHRDRSSEFRQVNSTTAFVQKNGWTICGEPIIDSGRSAFTGENLTKGHLGTLTKRLHTGAIDPRKTVIVVDTLDRLSRRPPTDMQAWMLPLLSLGLTIAVANTGQIITKKMLDDDIGGFLNLVLQAFAGYAFAKGQRDKGNASWEKRRLSMAVGILTARHRARKWLTWHAARKSFVAIPKRRRIIRLIFARYLKGVGKGAIAKEFNQRMANEPEFRPWPCGKRTPALWDATYIKRIIHDPAVIGYVQFTLNPRGAEKAIPVGAPIKVYPAVIREETFNRANDKRLIHQIKHQGKGRNVSNLFGPKARCAHCGGQMAPLGSSRWRTNKDGTRSQHYFLYCKTAKMTKGTSCHHQTGWTYSRIEQPLLDALLTRMLDNQHFCVEEDSAIEIEGRVFALRRRVDDHTKRANVLLRLIEPDEDGDIDEIAVGQYRELSATLKGARKALEAAQSELDDARGAVTPQQHLVRVEAVRERLDSDDQDERYEARITVKTALQSLVDQISFDDAKGRATVSLVGGLAVMFIDRRGQSMMFDLHKAGRDDYRASPKADQEAIAGYIRRKSEGR